MVGSETNEKYSNRIFLIWKFCKFKHKQNRKNTLTENTHNKILLPEAEWHSKK